jgi:hypothetical protein
MRQEATPTHFARSPSAGLWRSSTSHGSNRSSRPDRYAEEPPGNAAFAVHLAQLTLCPIDSPYLADLRPPFRPTRTVPVLKQSEGGKET